MTTQTAYLGLGSNVSWLGRSPSEIVQAAAKSLERFGDVGLSPLYGSPAWPDPSKPRYVNAVAALETALTPLALLAACQAIEAGFGRRRDPGDRNAPRTLDIDVICVGQARSETPALILPHARLAERDFVLAPLADVAPRWRHPVTGQGIADLLAALPERTAIRV